MTNQEPRFFMCEKCRIMIEEFRGNKDNFVCCGDRMKELKANTSEGAQEKHLPVVEQNGNRITVKVGSVFHPMSEEHSIEWVYLKTKKGGQRFDLKSDEEPAATFLIAEGDKAVAAYAFCNLHGFWMTKI